MGPFDVEHFTQVITRVTSYFTAHTHTEFRSWNSYAPISFQILLQQSCTSANRNWEADFQALFCSIMPHMFARICVG